MSQHAALHHQYRRCIVRIASTKPYHLVKALQLMRLHSFIYNTILDHLLFDDEAAEVLVEESLDDNSEPEENADMA